MSEKKFRSVSLRNDHLEEFEQIAKEMTAEDGADVSVPEVIYRAKHVLKKARAAKKEKES